MLLLSASTNSWSTSSIFDMIAQLFFILVVFVGVIFLAVYVTKWMGKAKYTGRGTKNLQIVDSLGIGFQNGIHLVKAGKKYVLLGITKDRITFLCELTQDDIEEAQTGEANQPSFENYLNIILNKKNKDGKQ